MYKLGFLAVVIALNLSLTGCMTKLSDELKYSTTNMPTEKADLILSDKIIAVGKSVKPIPNHPYALVMVGQKQIYFIEPANPDKEWHRLANHKPADIFANIYNKLDLNYMTISLDNELRYADKSKADKVMELQITDPTKPSTETWIGYDFKKPINLVTDKERATLAELNFHCDENKNNQIFSCGGGTVVTVTVNQAIDNPTQLTHQLKNPFDIEYYFVHYESEKSKYPKALKVLTPLAIAVDVITAPIRFGGKLIGNMGPTGN